MKSFSSQLLNKKIHRPLLFNIVVWVFSFIIFLFVFTKGKTPVKIDLVYTVGFLITIILPSLLNVYVLIPKFLAKEKYILFLFLFVINLVLFIKLNHWFLEPTLDYLLPNFFFISYTTQTGISIIFTIFLIAITLLKLSEDWFYFNREENQRLKIDNQHIQMQLTSLRSQINPHFLFNSLNVIYALALEKKEDTKDAIVQLSDILRYIIYDSNTQKITIEDEVTLLKNYIAFHQFRSHDTKDIQLNISIENKEFALYPMLLLPLVENSFKYGLDSEDKNAFIKIDLVQEKEQFNFIIENNNPKNKEVRADEYSGIGLKNIKNSLELVYPNAHRFSINETDDIFKVKLKLQNNV